MRLKTNDDEVRSGAVRCVWYDEIVVSEVEESICIKREDSTNVSVISQAPT